MTLHILHVQNAACKEQKPYALVSLLVQSFQQRWPDHHTLVPLEYGLRNAFGIPLRTVRDIEDWNGFFSKGSLTDHDLDTLFAPWIERFVQTTSNIQ